MAQMCRIFPWKWCQQRQWLVPLLGDARSYSAVATTCELSDAKPFEDIPGPRGIYRMPALGTVLNFQPFTDFNAETLHQLLRQMAQRYGPLFRIELGRPTVVVSDSRDIQWVYRNEGKFPSRPNLSLREVYAKRSGIKSMDVSTLQNQEWLWVRSSLNKLLVRVDSASAYMDCQSIVADDFVKILATQTLSPEQISDLFFRFASECIGLVCFNARLGLLDDRGQKDPETVEFLNATKDAFKMLHKSLTGDIGHLLYKNQTYRTYEEAINTVQRYSQRYITATKEALPALVHDSRRTDRQPNLIRSLLADGKLSESHVTQIIESLYSGGTDSTAGSLQAVFYNLAKHPQVQERLYNEIRDLLPMDQQLTPEILSKMQYLKACVKESFRCLYPVSGVMRTLPKDVVLSGYRVPAGVQILLANVLTCQDEFDDPASYIPERWLRSSEGLHERKLLTENSAQIMHSSTGLSGTVGSSDRSTNKSLRQTAVLPFGYGPRNCIGRRFAEQEIYLAVTKVVQSLKVDLNPKAQETPFVYRIFLQPSEPVHFIFTRRN